MRIFLSGPMGSGKSTLARAVGARAALPVSDLDLLIEQRAGKRVTELFAERGEAGFRELERATLRELLAANRAGVIALGGGSVTDRGLRRELLRQGTLITLRADVAELARRVGDATTRPLLAGPDHEIRARLAALTASRAEAYAECHAELDTQGQDIAALADRVLEIAADAAIAVPLGVRSYRVEVGSGIRMRLPERLAQVAPKASRVLLVTDQVVAQQVWAPALFGALGGTAPALRGGASREGRSVIEVVLGAGEQHKTLQSVDQIWQTALGAGIDRGSVVVGVGGGVVGDMAGFAAATLLRGLSVGHVPTTLLAMVDSAIGGKTGFDTVHGKNLIGAFHQPSFVLCDVAVLSTLPEAERRAGLAEVVKSAWIDGEESVAMLERDAPLLLAGEGDATVRAIRMSAALKARIVTEDEREAGARALLNLGHTLGHAIEAAHGYAGMRHGEAVALGMVAAFELAVRVGHATPADAERATRLLAALGLPTDVRPHLHERVLSFIGSDKKRQASAINYVLPGPPGRVELRSMPLDDLMRGWST